MSVAIFARPRSWRDSVRLSAGSEDRYGNCVKYCRAGACIHMSDCGTPLVVVRVQVA